MPAVKRARTHADDFKDLEDREPRDYDPEDEPPSTASDSGGESGSDDELEDRAGARDHYEPVEQSKLRRLRDPAALGPQYAGSTISRSRIDANQDQHDPLTGFSSDEESDVIANDEDIASEEGPNAISSDGEPSDDEAATDDTSMSDDLDADNSQQHPKARKASSRDADRAELRRLMQQQDNVATSISHATQLDADKGRAVKRQRKAFDALLTTRIRMQQGVAAFNDLELSSLRRVSNPADQQAVAAAESAALALWNNLESLRQTLDSNANTHDPRPQHLAIDSTTPSQTIWTHMQSREAAIKPTRDSTLNKWARKTAAATTSHLQQATAPRRLQPNSTSTSSTQPQQQQPLTSILAAHLSSTNMPSLLSRARAGPPTPNRPAAQTTTTTTTQTPANETYDDADLYATLLQDLLSQRQTADLAPADDGAAAPTAATMKAHMAATRKAAKTRKNVDTKASKGRKLRYTVHERLANFMAPEDRGAWGIRQREELFGSLLGRAVGREGAFAVDGADADADGGVEGGRDDDDEEEAALMLFRN